MSGKASLYMDYLAQEGYRPTIDSDGDVTFKHEGGSYYIDITEDDETYFRIGYPGFWSIESVEELARAISTANDITATTKVAKVYVRSDGKNTNASIEMFVDPPENFRSTFTRSMYALQASVARFRKSMQETAS